MGGGLKGPSVFPENVGSIGSPSITKGVGAPMISKGVGAPFISKGVGTSSGLLSNYPLSLTDIAKARISLPDIAKAVGQDKSP